MKFDHKNAFAKEKTDEFAQENSSKIDPQIFEGESSAFVADPEALANGQTKFSLFETEKHRLMRLEWDDMMKKDVETRIKKNMKRQFVEQGAQALQTIS